MIDLVNIFLGVLIGSTLGAYIGTEIAYRRTEKWLMKLAKDEKFRRAATDFIKDVAKRFEEEYLVPTVKSGRIRELANEVKKQVLGEPGQLPPFEDFE